MKQKKLSEFEWIQNLRQRTPVGRGVKLGIGDDTAILATSSKDLLLTTDMLIEDVHFRLKEATAYEIGWKALAVNVSDIAAMGGIARHAVVAVGLPRRLSNKFIDELYSGIQALARRFQINIVGGDTNASEKLVVSITVLGECEKSKAICRSGARVGDILFVTGKLGGSYASKKHLRFIPRVKEAWYLVQNFNVHAMMDLSDGLAGDIRRLTQESKVGAIIKQDLLPVASCASDWKAALVDGEDFELLFCLAPGEAQKLIRRTRQKSKSFFTPIGKIVNRGMGLLLEDGQGKRRAMPKGGFDHFHENK